MRIAIINGHLIDPRNQIDTHQDVYLADGKVAAVGTAPDGFHADQTIDATNQIVCPGFVDLCARLREPGQEHKGTIASETRAAVAGGITSLCIPPDTTPVIDTPAVVEWIHRANADAGFCRVYTMGALTLGLQGERLSEMAHLKQAGCVGVSNAMRNCDNPLVLRRAMEYAASIDVTVFLQTQVSSLANAGVAHEGAVSLRLGLSGIPEAAETQAVANYLMLVEQTGARVHFCRLSTARAIQMIGRAKYDGLNITADVAAHQLHLTEMDLGYFNSMCHVRPPLRTQRDMEALREAVADDRIEAICSDHQPHDLDAKLAPFADTEPGISALETFLPLNLRMVTGKHLTLSAMIERLSMTPAEILNIDAGHLSVGANADVAIFDPIHEWTLSADTMVSRGKNSPFLGWSLQGRVTHTLMGGKLVYQLGK
ncbi:MAG: dihydroorotase [Gammaproteobacteria bacterium]|nr:dihydroorotase [Gammaproteobacteria bacterium]